YTDGSKRKYGTVKKAGELMRVDMLPLDKKADCCSNTFSGSGGSDCQDRGRTSRKYFCFISNIRLKSCAISLIFNSILKPSWKIGSQQKTHFWVYIYSGNNYINS
ncbi:unnamed protein product, partial [Brassica oleracea]